ncbi:MULTISPECIES: plasmid partitioning protein RepB C-terminal domain-containing protein [Paraburkholderia]|uniref:RepB plasmid partition n=1 Tax=Paraburkholderia nemoris TaxID=2793076 RepID=A0ABN7N9Z1_9BURK|nr:MULTISPECIES: plasmid partitioning protein RepB C-terminal domain-containing protein [Paraburkholderia]KPD14816.1 RepB plasmid partition [Burkholderia sp. ST111]MBK5151799.1 ParB N-terminal domain-containing protein [Burkholderia sp. R-69608]MBK5184363.1 ParB N-terminal domain-containing protein [Burkholderia sp. R-69749]MBK3744684.1 ParB N-terminal domain-containing protein [Paraburkholderia aspalathi]MBK3815794.1 ParB N-terminal domain-containing protein [Paraburkholderia aspalathi]
MAQLTVRPLRAAFESQPVMLQLDALVSSRHLPNNATSTKKFLQILASVATVGLVEPLIVARIADDEGMFRILDGRLRVEALRRLHSTEALCLIATDDEAYTYNKHISRLTSAQDAVMIAKAIERGVLRERIALVLGIDIGTVKRRAGLLVGISCEAAALLADKACPATTFNTLKRMKPLRQLQAVELMCGQGNFTSAFARAIVAATPQEQLEQTPGSRKKSGNDVVSQLAKLERELATLQSTVAQTDERYGIEHLHLTVSAAYVATLVNNEHVLHWLNERHPDFAAQFETISKEARDARSASNSSGPSSKSFRRVGGDAAQPSR